MRRRELITLLGGATFSWPLTAGGQVPGRVYRVGGLHFGPWEAPHHAALRDQLRRLGFVEGENLVMDRHDYGLGSERFAEHAAALVEAKVDVILCSGAGIRTAQQATATIPILGVTDDMVGEGLVRSLASPGGNTTGISILATELDGKRQELLMEMIPGARRIAALGDVSRTAPGQLGVLQDAARARGVELAFHLVGKPEEIAPAIDTAKASGAAGLNVLATPLLFAQRRIVFERAATLDLPAMYQWPEMAREGGLAAYGPSIVNIYRLQVAPLLAKLLRGIKPADLPVQQPTIFELVINLKTAKALGIEIPQSILIRADEVIE